MDIHGSARQLSNVNLTRYLIRLGDLLGRKIDKHYRNVAIALTQNEKDNNILESEKLKATRTKKMRKMLVGGRRRAC